MIPIRLIKHSEFIAHDVNTKEGKQKLYLDALITPLPAIPQINELVSYTNFVNKVDWIIGIVIRIIHTDDGIVVVVHEEEID